MEITHRRLLSAARVQEVLEPALVRMQQQIAAVVVAVVLTRQTKLVMVAPVSLLSVTSAHVLQQSRSTQTEPRLIKC
mgnify:CR=1 FL=1